MNHYKDTDNNFVLFEDGYTPDSKLYKKATKKEIDAMSARVDDALDAQASAEQKHAKTIYDDLIKSKIGDVSARHISGYTGK